MTAMFISRNELSGVMYQHLNTKSLFLKIVLTLLSVKWQQITHPTNKGHQT